MTDVHLRQLLLRRLPADEAARLEDAILLEDGFAERLQDEEFDLLDDYAASRLNAEDAADVERHLLSSVDKAHSLRIGRALQDHREAGDKPKQPLGLENVDGQSRAETGGLRSLAGRRPRTPQIARVATLLAACLVAVVFIPRWRSIPRGSDPAAKSSGVPISPPSAESAAAGSDAQTPLVTLVADVNRGALRSPIAIPSDAKAVRLQAEVPEDGRGLHYSIRINDAAGRQLFDASKLPVRVAGPYQFVQIEVPAAALAPGDRTVLLTRSSATSGAAMTFTWNVTGVSVSKPQK